MDAARASQTGIVSRVQGLLLKTLWGRLVCVALVAALLGVAFAQPRAKPKREITLTAQSVPLSTADPKLDQAGALRFMGGLWLTSPDNGFGGFSGLSVSDSATGLQILAVSDQGDKLTARLILEDGRLRGLDNATIEPLIDLDGKPIAGKALGDAESITRLPDGRVLVGFERNHRIWAYGPGLTGTARVFETPQALKKAPSNGGLESIANWPDGRVLAVTEQMKTEDGNNAAFLFQGGAWTTLEWKPSAPAFEPSDAAVLPGGDLLVLERYWSALAPASLSSRIMRVTGRSVKPLALLQGEMLAELKAPLVTENFEGLATFTNASGKTQLLVISDDNFSGAQRTLLLSFEMRE